MEEYESYGNREWSEEEVEEEYENGYGNGDDGNNKQQGWEGKELGHNRRGWRIGGRGGGEIFNEMESNNDDNEQKDT